MTSDESRAAEALAAQLRQLAEPVAADAGVDLVDVAVRGSGPRRLVRVVVDRKGGVDLGTCQEVSRRLSGLLDSRELIGDPYQLEVTSPGTSHPLEGQRAFDRVEGRPVLVHRRDEEGRMTQLRGTVVQAQPEAVVLEVDGRQQTVAYQDIAKATQALPW